MEEKRNEEIRKNVDNIQSRPHVDVQPNKKEKKYIITITDSEAQFSIGVEATNIMKALKRFAERYQYECDDWFGLSIMVEEIEFI